MMDGIWLRLSSRRQFKHPAKPGRVTVSGHPRDDIHPKTLKSIVTQAGLGRRKEEGVVMQYAMIIEKGERNYSAYLPDLPGCIATGKTLEQVKQRMSEAVELHFNRAADLPKGFTGESPRAVAMLAIARTVLDKKQKAEPR
jgi:predicted RNase H-like HicB family nuclease